jgi:basic membrane protein A
MKLMKTLMGATAALAVSAVGALADGPAIIFDLGGKFDRSFNEAAFNGAQRWAEETGGTFREIELQSDAQREQAMRRLAEAGSNPIVMAGFSQATPLSVVAPDYPDTTFVIIDGVVEAPTCARSSSPSMRVPTSSACWPRWPPRPARSASSAAWTSR